MSILKQRSENTISLRFIKVRQREEIRKNIGAGKKDNYIWPIQFIQLIPSFEN
ncbi:MAG TPA: hypothetical protein VK253_02825 [Candidatus Binatia bacterium]|nr:hypothetical protein [Candidatus Binatia bacterium]